MIIENFQAIHLRLSANVCKFQQSNHWVPGEVLCGDNVLTVCQYGTVGVCLVTTLWGRGCYRTRFIKVWTILTGLCGKMCISWKTLWMDVWGLWSRMYVICVDVCVYIYIYIYIYIFCHSLGWHKLPVHLLQVTRTVWQSAKLGLVPLTLQVVITSSAFGYQ